MWIYFDETWVNLARAECVRFFDHNEPKSAGIKLVSHPNEIASIIITFNEGRMRESYKTLEEGKQRWTELSKLIKDNLTIK